MIYSPKLTSICASQMSCIYDLCLRFGLKHRILNHAILSALMASFKFMFVLEMPYLVTVYLALFVTTYVHL